MGHLPRAKQGEVKGGRGVALTRKISFVSKWLMVPRSFYSASAMGGYSF